MQQRNDGILHNTYQLAYAQMQAFKIHQEINNQLTWRMVSHLTTTI
jgi:hypothetical protein